MTLRRFAAWAAPLALLVAGLVWAFRPTPLDVDVHVLARGPLEVTVVDEGRASIREVYEVSAPVRGRLLRVQVHEGDPAVAGETLIAEIEPAEPEFLDTRAAAEARAAVDTARAALAFARAGAAQAKAELDFAQAEVDRMRELRQRGAVSARALEDAERTFLAREAVLATAKAAIDMRISELRAVETRLITPGEAERRADGECPCVDLRAPVDGLVLRVLRESEGVVEVGEPVAEIGDPANLEIVAEFLSAEAVRIEEGMPARIEAWGGRPLAARVRRVEPMGFETVSALGIEERRVEVVLDIEAPRKDWLRLGHGFQVEARVILWTDPGALSLPLTSLVRGAEGGWAVWTVVGGRAVRREVEVGRRAELSAEVVSGLEPGATVIRFPSDRIEEGVPVAPR